MRDAAAKSTGGDSGESEQVQQLMGMLAEKDSEIQKLQATLKASQNDLEQTIAALKEENAELKKTDTQDKIELASAQETNNTLTSDLQALRSAEVSGQTSSTVSSGVKVEKPAAVAKKILDDDDEEDWGDDWD